MAEEELENEFNDLVKISESDYKKMIVQVDDPDAIAQMTLFIMINKVRPYLEEDQ